MNVGLGGKTGGGKSYAVCRKLVNEVLPGRHLSDCPEGRYMKGDFINPIVLTNVPFLIEGIREYMAKNSPEWFAQADLDNSLVIWDYRDESKFVPQFWRFRGEGEDGKSPTHQYITKAEWKDTEIEAVRDDEGTVTVPGSHTPGIRPNWRLNSRPVVYILDELHKFINSRTWASSHPAIIDYTTQMRHFGDRLFWMTQQLALVDSQFRSVTNEYWLTRDMSKERIGKFRKGSGFVLRVYQDEKFTPPADSEEKYDLDKTGIGSCYETSIIGGKADGGRKAKALPFSAIYGLFGFILVAAVGILWFLPDLIGFFVDSPVGEETELEEVPVVASDLDQLPSPVRSVFPSSFTPELPPPYSVAGAVSREIPKKTVIVQLDNLQPSEVARLLGSESGNGGNLSFHPIDISRQLILTGSEAAVAEMSLIASAVDSKAQTGTVVIKAAIGTVELSDNESSDISATIRAIAQAAMVPIRTTSAAAIIGNGLTFGLESGGIDSVVSAISGSGRFSVVSRPYMRTVNGVPVEIRSGREIPVSTLSRDQVSTTTTTVFRPVELALSVTPYKIEGGYRLVIVQSNSEVIGSSDQATPTLATQSITATIDIAEGEVVALGGVVVDSYRDSYLGAPLLGRVPLVRRLGGKVERVRQRRELVLLLQVGEGLILSPTIPVPVIDPDYVGSEYRVVPQLGDLATDRPEGFNPSSSSNRRKGLLRRLFEKRE
jgi:hypothetical protein